MTAYQFNIDALNAGAVAAGGTGGHGQNIDALNELCTLAGGTGGHGYGIDALNELAVLYGGTGGHRYNIDALNEIATLREAEGGPFSQQVDAYSALVELWGAAFTPTLETIFANGEPGAAIDFITPENNFTTSAGSTNVAVFGDPIGRSIDLSPNGKNAVQATSGSRPTWRGWPTSFGSELITNGRMDADSDWTKGTGWSIGSGIASKSAGTAASLSQAVAGIEEGSIYLLTYSMKRTAGTVTPRLVGDTTVSGVARSAAGSYLEIFIAPAGSISIDFLGNDAFAGSVDNVSLRECLTFSDWGAFMNVSEMATAAIDMTGTDKMTVVAVARNSEEVAGRDLMVFGAYKTGGNGTWQANMATAPRMFVRGDTAASTAMSPQAEGNVGPGWVTQLVTYSIDLAQSDQADEVSIRCRGADVATTFSGSAAGGGNFASGALNFAWKGWKDLFWRAVVIGRLLTEREIEAAERWCIEHMSICAVIGDSTTAATTSDLTHNYTVSGLVPSMVCGGANLARAGERIASQKTAWGTLVGKSALQAVFVQIGLNDIYTYVGGGTKTAAEVIADLQDLIDTIRGDVAPACRIYACALTPARAWLETSTNGAAAYQGWLDVNEAIAGEGDNPITGVDARITSYVDALADEDDNLAEIYDSNPDGVHENVEARLIIAAAWRAQLVSDGLVAA